MSISSTNKESVGLWESLKILFGTSKGFWLVNLVNFGDGIFYFAMLTLMTRFFGARLGMSDYLTGVSVSMYTGLVTLFMIGGGFVSDKLGVRRALTFSLAVILAGRALLSASVMLPFEYFSAWTGLVLMAFGTGVLQPALYAGVKEYTDERTATIAYGLLYSIMNLGIIAGNFISPFIREDKVFLDLSFTKIIGLGWGIDGVYWICTFLTGALLLAHMVFFTKKVEEKDRVTVDIKPEKNNIHLTLKEKLYNLPILDKRFLFFIFILLPVRTLFAHQWLTMPDYIFRCYPDYVSAKFEWINGLNPLIIVIFVPLIAAFTRKVKVLDMMIIGTTVSAITTFMLVPGPNLSALLSYVIIFSLGEAIWSSRFLEYIADIAPAGKVGAYMGIAGLPWFLAKFTTGFYSGAMLNHFVPKSGEFSDSGTMWLIYAIIACISPLGLMLGRKWLLKYDTK